MNNTGQSNEDQNANRYADSIDWAQRVSAQTKDSIGSCTRGHECCNLAENLSSFCPCPETLRDSEIKGDGIFNVAEEISKKPYIQAVALVLLAAFS